MIATITSLFSSSSELSYSFDWFGWGVTIHNGEREFAFDARDVTVGQPFRAGVEEDHLLQIKDRETDSVIFVVQAPRDCRQKFKTLHRELTERCYKSLEAERRETANIPVMKVAGTMVTLSFQDAIWSFNKNDIRGVSAYCGESHVAEGGTMKTVPMQVVKISLSQRRVIKLQVEKDKGTGLVKFHQTFSDMYSDYVNTVRS